MKNKENQTVDVDRTASELFQLRNQIKELKTKEAKLQAKIDQYSDEHIGEFVKGEWKLPNCVVKIQQNPPKLVHEGSGKPLSVNEREKLAEQLELDYIETKPNLSKIIARLNGDKILKKTLQAKRVNILQSTRYVAKPY